MLLLLLLLLFPFLLFIPASFIPAEDVCRGSDNGRITEWRDEECARVGATAELESPAVLRTSLGRFWNRNSWYSS